MIGGKNLGTIVFGRCYLIACTKPYLTLTAPGRYMVYPE
jgi:hypothetical protein